MLTKINGVLLESTAAETNVIFASNIEEVYFDVLLLTVRDEKLLVEKLTDRPLTVRDKDGVQWIVEKGDSIWAESKENFMAGLDSVEIDWEKVLYEIAADYYSIEYHDENDLYSNITRADLLHFCRYLSVRDSDALVVTRCWANSHNIEFEMVRKKLMEIKDQVCG